MSNPVKYLENESVSAMINNAPEYEKSALTALRRPRPEEIGSSLSTYVYSPNDAYQSDGDTTVRLEATNTITDNHVIARNPNSKNLRYKTNQVFNEWLIEIKNEDGKAGPAIKNYGANVIENLTTEFSLHKRAGTIKAIELTQELLNDLGGENGELKIKVDWSEEPMTACMVMF